MTMKGINKIYFIMTVIVLLVILAVFLQPKQVSTKRSTTTLAKPEICGNDICGSGESRFNCCSDCPCIGEERCDEIKQRCEIEFSLERSDAENAVRQYLGRDYEMVESGITEYEGKKVMLIYVYTPDTRLFAVDENRVVTEIELD